MATRYIALLRGINVGGNKKIKMADLREMLASLGFENIKTALASGNVALDADHDDVSALKSQIEQGIETTFGFTVPVIVFAQQQINDLIEKDPFTGIETTKDKRLYVTFLPEPTSSTLSLPHQSDTGDFAILDMTDIALFSVLTVTNTRSVDAMAVLEKAYGKSITTRNWNTVLKLGDL